MKKSISKILMVITVLLSAINSFAQIKNLKTESVKIYGNCEMCKTTIEKAGNLKNVAIVHWNIDTKMAAISYDSKKTDLDEILKRIALVGYDNEQFLAPDDVYSKLPGCCQYDRTLKPFATNRDAGMDMRIRDSNEHLKEISGPNTPTGQNVSQLQNVFDSYFSVKDALVMTDAAITSAKAAELLTAVKAVDMAKLSTQEHTVWMKLLNDLTENAGKIAKAKEVSEQRETFVLLSANIYELAKVSKQETPVYYQHCPMFHNGKGANWLSKEEAVKNPYYGSKMLTCGSVQETINNK